MSHDKEIVIVPSVESQRAEELNPDSSADPIIGRWYWVKVKNEKKPTFCCVIHIGSNYVEVQAAGTDSWTLRILLSEFWDKCEFESNPDKVIANEINRSQNQTRQLMEQVREITARLAITPGLALPGGETSALALRREEPVEEYKAALVLAKEKTLPELFQQIKNSNDHLGRWMKAQLIPMIAQAEAMQPAIESIKNRIFSVELYAGLVESVEQIAEGDPAEFNTKIHLLQRRCYMDEECLARYEAGGMEFKDIGAFDKWLAKPENRDRILPFERCIVAFQVRRAEKEREWGNLSDFFKMMDDREADKMTFLYIRNGQQLFRLRTKIDFGCQLFPDVTQDQLNGKMYARTKWGRIEDGLIPEGRYKAMVEEEIAHDKYVKSLPKKDRWHNERHFRKSEEYTLFSPKNVYYDDIIKFIQDEMARHNRLVLVLQGLLDRSPVLHPHPAWTVWSNEGFKAALELIYDDSRTLVAGDAPDFEAYRARLNASLTVGSVTIGQQDVWEIREGQKESARMDREERGRGRRSDYRPTRHRPHGNPGPGTLSRVQEYKPKAQNCVYKWNRKTSNWRNEREIQDTITINQSRLLNVDAYKIGDFKQFFADPRTRADYLKWAPILLEAEEYHHGNRKVEEAPPKPPAPERDPDASLRYQIRKLNKAMVGKAVRLTKPLETKGGSTYEVDSLWRVTDHCGGGRFNIRRIDPDGSYDKDYQLVRLVEKYYFKVDHSIPQPKSTVKED